MCFRMSARMKTVTCKAPVNIAVVKYWGKRNEELILPINSSLSASLHTDHLCATTTISASRDFKKDRIWLNGKEEDFNNPRLKSCLRAVKQRSKSSKTSGHDSDESNDWHLHICSENNFPTAAGLASSAAGYACLVACLARLYDIPGNVSDIARQGSGSASRSLEGGFVQWIKGEKKDGSDSIGEQVAPETHWPEMRILILVVSAKKKDVGSSKGMQQSVSTSSLIKYRAESVVPQLMEEMLVAIRKKDFHKFAEITMRESNQLHAVCLDTYPPISYMNDVSRKIVKFVHAFNKHKGCLKVAYTFDAGPNACLYLLEEVVEEVISAVNYFFPPVSTENGEKFVRGMDVEIAEISEELKGAIDMEPETGGIKYIIHTKPGPGAHEVQDPEVSLLDDQGLPKFLKSSSTKTK